jgi:hypothetical protein
VFNPPSSWSAKWLRLGACGATALASLPVRRALRQQNRYRVLVCRVCPPTRAHTERQVPGCYALSVTDKIAEEALEQMED